MQDFHTVIIVFLNHAKVEASKVSLKVGEVKVEGERESENIKWSEVRFRESMNDH